MSASALTGAVATEQCRPWPRHVLAPAGWAALAGPRPALALLALWADTVQVHALWLDEAAGTVLPVSIAVEAGQYPALSPAWPVAAWFERLVHDLWGHAAVGGSDQRTWLDHGRWPHAQPLSTRPGPPSNAELPAFAELPGDGLMQVPLGPLHGLVDEAAHLRLTTRGATILRAEARLGYTHKGTLTLMRGKSPRAAARFAARLAGDATVAHALAFARATEAALDVAAPPRAAALRAVMTELERMAVHFGDLAELADAAGLAGLHAACGERREGVVRAANAAFGHRLMMDCVVPGGVAGDIAAGGVRVLRDMLDGVADALPALHRRHDIMLARLEGVGLVNRSQAVALAAGGVAGRAAGRRFDVRQLDPVYRDLPLASPTERCGDAAARVRVRLAELAASAGLARAVLAALPEGPLSAALPAASGEGIGCAESPRGDIWHWLRLDHGQIAAVFPRDPGWALWPLAEAALTGRSVEEVDIIRRSFSLPASALDL